MSYLTEEECVTRLAERVGYKGLGGWLYTVGKFLSFTPPFPPEKAVRFYDVTSPAYGIAVRLHYPAWESTEKADPYGWVLYEITFESNKSKLPFYLDTQHETPVSAQKKLSTDMDRSSSGVTYFLADNRVIYIAFRNNFVRIDKVKLNRLYLWPDWRMTGQKKKS